MALKLHIKNNHAGADTFPSTPESEPVFTISLEKYQQAMLEFPDLAAQLEESFRKRVQIDLGRQLQFMQQEYRRVNASLENITDG